MIDLRCTLAGDVLEQRFVLIGDARERNRLRNLLIGATVVKHTLTLPHPGVEGSCERERITLVANVGVANDMRSGGLVRVDMANECVLARMYGMVGGQVANRDQVMVTDLDEHARLAARLGIDRIPIGAQGENLVLEDFKNLSLNIAGVSDLWPGNVVTFIAPDGTQRTASLHVVNVAQPYAFVWARIVDYCGYSPAMEFDRAVEGNGGIAAIVKTTGEVHKGDIALVWKHA